MPECPFRFSIVVPTYQRCDVLMRCLQGLASLECYWPVEAIVVVDGSRDGSLEAAESAVLPFGKRVLFQENAGAAAARNRGAAEARGDYLLFLDDDMVADPRLLVEHEKLLDDGAEAVVGHIPLHPDSPRSILTLGVERWAKQRLARLRNRPGCVALPDLVTGQLSVRASTFRSVGGFDANFNAGGTFGAEDTDFLYRLISHGASLRAAPDAKTYQLYIKTPGQYLRQWREGGRADVMLARKHPELAAQLLHQHGRRGLAGRLYGVAAILPAPVKIALKRRVISRVASGRTDALTRWAFSRVRDAQYWQGSLEAGGIASAQRTIRVLAYHAIEDVTDPVTRRYCVLPEEFTAQIEGLVAAGYHFVTAQEFLTQLDSDQPPQRPSVLLTFDDGYLSQAAVAAPLLRRLGIPAVVFLVTAQIGGTNAWDVARGAAPLPLLDLQSIRQLLSQGWAVGAHSRQHVHAATLDRRGLHSEIGGARLDLEAFGLPPSQLFAYPYGEHHVLARRAAKRAGYRAAFTLDQGAIRRDDFALPRVEVQRGESPAAVIRRLEAPLRPHWAMQARREVRSILHALLRSKVLPCYHGRSQ